MSVKESHDSILSYLISGFLVFYGFVVDHGSDLAIFLGVLLGCVRLVHDIHKYIRFVKTR